MNVNFVFNVTSLEDVGESRSQLFPLLLFAKCVNLFGKTVARFLLPLSTDLNSE